MNIKRIAIVVMGIFTLTATISPALAETVSVPAATAPARVLIGGAIELTSNEATMYDQDDCLVGPLTLTRPLYKWAAEEGVVPCSKKFYAKADDFIGKESTIGWRLARAPDGHEVCVGAKSTNLGNNRMRCVTYVFRTTAAGAPLGAYGDANWAAGGDTMKAQTFQALIPQLFGAVSTVAAAEAISGGNNCRKGGGCGGGTNVTVTTSASGGNGGNANAAAGSSSAANVTTSGTGGCGSGPCPATPTNPTHTQDGPGGS
ncbi:MAG: hypothetical protein AAB618_03715 [Patescibacteria group bacterium]